MKSVKSELTKYATHCAFCRGEMIQKGQLETTTNQLLNASGEKLHRTLTKFLDVLHPKHQILAKYMIDNIPSGKNGELIIGSYKEKLLNSSRSREDELFNLFKKAGCNTKRIANKMMEDANISIDHFTPVKQNGKSNPENLLFVHKACNEKKGSQGLMAFLDDITIQNILHSLHQVKKNARGAHKELADKAAVGIISTINNITGKNIQWVSKGYNPSQHPPL